MRFSIFVASMVIASSALVEASPHLRGKAMIHGRDASANCQKAFRDTAGTVLSTCKIPVEKASFYVFAKIAGADASYVKKQCAPYCTSSTAPGSEPFTVSPACEQAISKAAKDVLKACGNAANANSVAQALLKQTAQNNLAYVQAQCAPYCKKTFACPPTDRGDEDESCYPTYFLVQQNSKFPRCEYTYSGNPESSYISVCTYNPDTGALNGEYDEKYGSCCKTKAVEK